MAWIVNRHGTVHAVPDDWPRTAWPPGARPATAAEIAAWHRRQGLPVPGEDPPAPAAEQAEEASDARAADDGGPAGPPARGDRRPRRR